MISLVEESSFKQCVCVCVGGGGVSLTGDKIVKYLEILSKS